MKRHIVALYDRQLGAFFPPAFVPSLGVAMRNFADEVNRPEAEIRKHPEDYELFELGAWDDETGRFDTHEPKPLAKATVVIQGA